MGAVVKAAVPLGLAGVLPLNCAKANVAHSETAAGMSGLLALLLSLHKEEIMPNAQLLALNPHLSEIVSCGGVALPLQRTTLSGSHKPVPDGATGSFEAAACPSQSVPGRTRLFDTSTPSNFQKSLSQASVAALHLSLIGKYTVY